MGRIIALTAKSKNGQAYSKPRVVYLQENAIKTLPSGKTTRGTWVEETLEGRTDRYELYEKAMHIEASRNPSSSDILVKQHCSLAMTGAGTTQGAGTAISKYLSEPTTIGAGATEAFKLDAATVGKVRVIINNDASGDDAKIFPATGETINGAAANAVYSLTAGNRVHLVCLVAGAWVVADDFGK
jgi:hypothetical protein